MRKSQLEVLGKVFHAEIEGRLPYQTRSAEAKKLAEEGYLEFGEVRHGNLTISGYWLTEPGRFAWCQICADFDESEIA